MDKKAKFPPQKWEQLYGQKVWSKCKDHWWPSLVYDPSTLSKVNSKLKEQSNAFVGTKYTLRYLGMYESAAYGFASARHLRPFCGEDDPLCKQDAETLTRHRKEFVEGLKLMLLEETSDYRFFTALFDPVDELEVTVVPKSSRRKHDDRSSSSHSQSSGSYVMGKCTDNRYFDKRLVRFFPDESGTVRPYEGRVVGYLPEEQVTSWFTYKPMYHVLYSEDEDEEDLSERSLQDAIRRFNEQPDLVRKYRRPAKSIHPPARESASDALSQSCADAGGAHSLQLTFASADESASKEQADKKQRLDLDIWTLDDYHDMGLIDAIPGGSSRQADTDTSPATEIAALSTSLCTLEAEQKQLEQLLSGNLEKQKNIKAKLHWLTMSSFDE